MLSCQLLAAELITSHAACDAPEDFAITPEEFPWKGLGGVQGPGARREASRAVECHRVLAPVE